MNDPRLPRRRAGVGVHRLQGASALVDDERVHIINATALALWELCDGSTRPEEMIDAVCALFGADRDAIERDVTSTLEEFGELGLIEWQQQ